MRRCRFFQKWLAPPNVSSISLNQKDSTNFHLGPMVTYRWSVDENWYFKFWPRNLIAGTESGDRKDRCHLTTEKLGKSLTKFKSFDIDGFYYTTEIIQLWNSNLKPTVAEAAEAAKNYTEMPQWISATKGPATWSAKNSKCPGNAIHLQ